MRSILEKSFVALLNEEHDKAEELFHKFMVERARQIHEANRAGEDFVLDENWEEEIKTETHFTEEDLSDLEFDGDEEVEVDADIDGGDVDVDAVAFDTDDAGADEASDELDTDLGFDAESDDLGADEDRLDVIDSKIDDLISKFEAAMDAIGADDLDDEEDFDADLAADVDADADVDAEVDAFDAGLDSDEADALEDDMSDDEDDFDDINESIIDELEKVQVTLSDGKEIGNGPSVNTNKTSTLSQKTREVAATPIKTKVTPHKGFEREQAPAVAELKARRNTLKKKAVDVPTKVSKDGNEPRAELNTLKSDGNNKSVLPIKK